MVSTFRIVLKQEEGQDSHQTREFDLELEAKFNIGRASKNISKGYLQPQKHNVYIDSPVVSREHAVLTANAISGTPRVYITDTKSMHGTFVNGSPLVPETPKQLSDGDQLQFGVNVNRNESYFVASKYLFNAQLSNSEPFSRGFTVPEAESEDEDLGLTHAGRGSQLNPWVLDDFDLENENHGKDVDMSEDTADLTATQLEGENEIVEIVDVSSVVGEEHADESGAGETDDSDSESTDSVLDYNAEAPLAQEAHYVMGLEADTPTEHDRLSTTQAIPEFTELEQEPALRNDLEAQTCSAAVWHEADVHVTFPSDMFCTTIPPPLPPRPSQTQQITLDGLSDRQELEAKKALDVPSWAPLDVSGNDWDARLQWEPSAYPSPETPVIATLPPSAGSKRSADDAFSEESKHSEQKASEPENEETAAPANAVSTVSQVSPTPQRPIAQPRSILRRALNAAKVMVPATALGAVFTVGALTALPESFFTVP